MALSIALSDAKTYSVGNRKKGVATLTLTASSTTAYAAGGIALPTGWDALLGCPTKVDEASVPGYIWASAGAKAFPVHIDITNEKMIVLTTDAGAGGALDEGFTEHSAADFLDGTYVGTLVVHGN